MNVVRKVGRPTLYDPDYCDQLLEHMAQGYSFESFAGKIGTHRDTLYDWCDRHEEFLDARKTGQAVALYFYEKIGIAGTLGKLPGFNASMWCFQMKNRFNWTDRREETTKMQITHQMGQPSLEELKKALEYDQVVEPKKEEAPGE